MDHKETGREDVNWI